MIIYVSLYTLLALIGLGDWTLKQRLVLLKLLCLGLVVFVGFRFETGCDFSGYLLRFRFFNQREQFDITMPEPGFFLLTLLVKRAGLDYMWLNVIGAAIFFYFVASFARRHPRPLLLLALLFPLLVIQLSMSGLRQAIAVAFLMGAFSAFLDGKRARVIVFVLFASSFHQSAILLLPLALMVGKTFSPMRIILALVLLTPVAVVMISSRLDVYQERYIEEIYGEMHSSGAMFRLGIVVLISLLFYIKRRQLKALYPREYNLMGIFALASLAIAPIALINTVVVHRLIYYVAPMQLFTFAVLPMAMAAELGGRRTAELLPVGVFLLYMLVWFSLSRHANICYVPYQSYLFL